MPKKIIYLFGSGASHAVVKEISLTYGLMTSHIQDYISQKYQSTGFTNQIWGEVTNTTRDVEHLISVLESQYNYIMSEKLKGYYHNALVDLSKAVSKLTPVTLYTILADLHLNIDESILDESLLCFISLNYEDILEKSIVKHLNYDVDYSVQTTQKTKRQKVNVIKLHGSFNWVNSCPVKITGMVTALKKNALWIPPGLEKRKENYPFNLLWGKAREFLMECDVLRVVGCSLSRNDWGIIPMIYTVQKFSDLNKTIEIQIIDYPDSGDKIRKNYNYLDVKTVIELEDIINYYKEKILGKDPNELLSSSELSALQIEMNNNLSDKDKVSPFKIWLEAKIEMLFNKHRNNLDPIKKARFVEEFFYKK